MSRSLRSQKHLELCRLLKAERIKAGLIQKKLAKKLKRPQSYVSKYETGERRLDLLEFLEVAEAIDFEPCEFIKKLTFR